MSNGKSTFAKWLWERIEKHGFLAILLAVMLVDHAYKEYIHEPTAEAARQKYIAEQLQLSRTHFDKILEEIKEAYKN